LASRSRAERIISRVPAYAGFRPVEITWQDFRENWVPELIQDGMSVGVNWSGAGATGYDVEPEAVVANVEFYLKPGPGESIQ
jgi:hypothetical protein